MGVPETLIFEFEAKNKLILDFVERCYVESFLCCSPLGLLLPLGTLLPLGMLYSNIGYNEDIKERMLMPSFNKFYEPLRRE
jgi:hypothetical protein